ncbi:MAG: class I SAM-dependent methyltransferase [Cytophagaceae bacterium]
MECKVCGHVNGSILFPFSDQRNIWKCNACGLQYLHPVLEKDELIRLYSKDYYKSWGLDQEQLYAGLERVKKSTFELRIKLIQKYKSGGNILDIGCANGFFLEVARDKGFNPFGIEISEYSARLAAQKFGKDKIFNGVLEEAKFPEPMEVITMFDLIEHVYDPVDLLKRAKALLKENGIIVITTPNTSSLSNKLMGRKWTHYKLEHFFYFNLDNIKIAAEQAGLKVLEGSKSQKKLSIEYICNQFKIYKHPLLSPLAGIAEMALPAALKKKPLGFYLGEFTVVLQKIA